MKKPKIIIVLGPTSTGKSAVGVRLAQEFDGEIISADSRQVYVGLDIGTGKITKKEMCGIPHHLLDIANPQRTVTAATYAKKGTAAIKKLLKKNHIPVIVGGTGFYIDALTRNVLFPSVPPNKNLRKKLARKTAAELFQLLLRKDPKRARTIDPNNTHRLIRALEIVAALGAVPKKPRSKDVYDVLRIGLFLTDTELRKKIHVRLLARMRSGMLAEAKRLHTRGLSWKRMNELGLEYRFMAQHLQGKISKPEMLELLEKAIWQYARRQKTWFRKDTSIHWFSPTEYTKIRTAVRSFLG